MRQAVVLIHGIGEPRPMSTLRSFVEGVLGDDVSPDGAFRSKPDQLSESYELRRLVADGTRTRPTTDFYEYYWAHLMEGNTVGHVWPLARLLFLRWPWTVPAPLRALWIFSWVLLVAVAGIWIRILNSGDEWKKSSPLMWALATIGLVVVQVFVSKYLGDAARYLSPNPENVGIRQKIRSGGIEVVRRIQTSRKYDRITIVGHSLGSVIGYDIITHLWDETNTIHALLDRPKQDALKKLEQVGRQLTSSSTDALRQYRDLQQLLWLEQRALGNPWLVTDFITLGCPMTYGGILFARDDHELQRRQADRELPTCPPATDAGKYAYRSETYFVNGAERNLRILHHAAPFAVTRWTNIFVPLRLGVLGDWIGGPLQQVFGFGIKDVPLRGADMENVPLAAHTAYWKKRALSPGLRELVDALSLNSRQWLGRVSTTPAEPKPSDDSEAQALESQPR